MIWKCYFKSTTAKVEINKNVSGCNYEKKIVKEIVDMATLCRPQN